MPVSFILAAALLLTAQPWVAPPADAKILRYTPCGSKCSNPPGNEGVDVVLGTRGGPCGPSSIQIIGTRSMNGADYDGSTEMRFTVGPGRVLLEEVMDAPTVTLANHNDPGPQTHEWSVQAARAGIHKVRFEASTRCSLDGSTEPLNVAYTQWTAGSKCADQSEGFPQARRDVKGVGPSYALTMNGSQPVTRLIVGFTTMPALSVGSSYQGAPVVFLDSVLRFAVMGVSPQNLAAFSAGVTNDSNARYCEPEHLYYPHTNDFYYSQQYALERIRAPESWSITVGSTNKNLCIIDSGMDYTHPDLPSNSPRWLGGYDFINTDTDPMDDYGHGTRVAGIAAATTNNQVGIAGLAQVGIKAVKVFSRYGRGATSPVVASAIRWCADNQGDVISMSLGSPSPDPVVADAVDYAWNQGALLVASVGNEDQAVEYPAALPRVIAVACTDIVDVKCVKSNHGPEVDLAAPGLNVFTTCTDIFPSCSQRCMPDTIPDYSFCSGTSFSVPHVSGAAALIWSYLPGLTNQQVREYLECSAGDLGVPGWDPLYGNGLLDVKSALDNAIAGTCGAACSGTVTPDTTNRVNGVHQGTTTVRVSHTLSYHPRPVVVTASDGATMSYPEVAHDVYQVTGPNQVTRTVTFKATLSCGTVISASWVQFN